MIKKIFKIIGSFFLVLLILIVIAAIWSSITASKYDEKAKPYFDENVEAILSWDYERFRPLLSLEAREAFDDERGQKTYQFFSKLGQLQSVEDPEFINNRKGTNLSSGSYDHSTFLLRGDFENGKAFVTVTLALEEEEFKLHHIIVNSDVFIE